MQCIAIAIYAFKKLQVRYLRWILVMNYPLLSEIYHFEQKVEKFLFLIFIVNVCKNDHHYNNHQKNHMQSCFSISYDVILLTL